MTRKARLMMFVAFSAITGLAVAEGADDSKALIAALSTAKVTLQQGLEASAASGTPISAKFEIDDGHLQLSVYTHKNNVFSEVTVDLRTGKVAKSEAITEGDDLAAAKSQAQAIDKAHLSLRDAVSKAEGQYTGFHAISATAALREGHAIARIQLHKGTVTKEISEALE